MAGKSAQGREYAVSLDLGTGSVGWAAFYENYHLVRAKGRELIGVRLFEAAQTAEDRRMHRTTRRRLSRRRWRINLLNDMFAPELTTIDENFLARRKYSWVHPSDTANTNHMYGGLLFETLKQDKEFYKKYPTIYHLRKALMEDDTKHDLREIYTAIHHILKYRGNFLTEGEIKADTVFNPEDLKTCILSILESVLEIQAEQCVEIDAAKLGECITNTRYSNAKRADLAFETIQYSNLSKADEKIVRSIVKAICKAIAGNQCDPVVIFHTEDISSEDAKALRATFSDENIEDKFNDMASVFSEKEMEYMQSLYKLYSAITLKRLLGDSTTISETMCNSYDEHRKNWKLIKEKLRNRSNAEQINDAYLAITHQSLRGDNADTREKKIKAAYTTLRQIIESSTMLDEESKTHLLVAIETERLFPIQRTSANGVIPYQLHLNELRKILDKQAQYYPFLNDCYTVGDKQIRKIEGLLRFRVPYYVGPLVAPDQMQAADDSSNHWMVRKAGKSGVITPWSFHDIVDTDQSAKNFIDRLVGTDTYLIGEPTVPKNSLLYQEFEVLNELNNVRVQDTTTTAKREPRLRRLSIEEKNILLEKLFKTRREVSTKSAEEKLGAHHGESVRIFGLSNPKKFNSSLSSYVGMCKILGREYVDTHTEVVEKILEIQTVFEDKKMLEHQLSMLGMLSKEQIRKLATGHITGWGNLSRKLLESHEVLMKLSGEIMPTKHSVMQVLRSTDNNLMEIIMHKANHFQQWIDEQNLSTDAEESLEEQVQQLHISPKAKRGITQAIRVIDDITKAVGYAPSRIFVETADDFQESTQTRTRKSVLLSMLQNTDIANAVESISKSYVDDLLKKIKDTSNNELQNNRLYLYFLQLGKDMYSGEPLNIEKVSTDYDVDHIIPQAMTKDDSLDNLVLVKRSSNARKSDSPTLDSAIIARMRPFWKYLYEHGLISAKKLKSLTRDSFSDDEKKRFVARSLVETRQVVKNVSDILRKRYGASKTVVGLNSKQTMEMRRYLGFGYKNRDINDYHHAQDALCIGIVGQFAVNRGFFAQGEVSDGAFNSYNLYLQKYLKEKREDLNKGEGTNNPFGFIVGSMRSSREDLRVNPLTGEIVWSEEDKNYIRKVMNFSKILISHKVGDDFGALYDETRYGHEKKSLIAFRKQQKDTALYGGFSGRTVAFIAMVQTKKGEVRLVDVPALYGKQVQQASTAEEKMQVIESYEPKMKGARYIASFPKGQLIRYRGQLFTIKSSKELNNAQQLWLSQPDYNDVSLFVRGGELEETRIIELFDMIAQRLQQYFPELAIPAEKCQDVRAAFIQPTQRVLTATKKNTVRDFQRHIIEQMLIGMHANATRTDALKAIGLKSEWGRFKKAVVLQPDDEIIYTSASGLYVQVKTVEEICAEIE